MESKIVFNQKDLILKVNENYNRSCLNLDKWERFLDILCGDRVYQKEAIKSAVVYLASGMYNSLADIVEENYRNNSELMKKYLKLDDYKKSLQIKDKLFANIDLATGSGSLLLKAEKILGRDKIRNGFYGQEINITTYNLCRINMFLHDIGFDKFNIACEDTLIAPAHWDDEPFELIVSNPPYSIKWVGDENPLLINDPRFAPAGVLAPKSKADLAFIMHSLSWLASNGTAAIVCFPGIMYRGGAEKKIRKYLIDNNYIDCIIQLPPNLFFGTSIATCIMVMKKNKADNKTLFIDATSECIKVTNNNKLTQDNMDKIVNCFANRSEIAHFSHLATYDEISENDYNLSVSTYVETEDTREKIDIVKLNAEIEKIVAREQVLRDEIAKIIAEIEVQ